jgi:hypothetical protein
MTKARPIAERALEKIDKGPHPGGCWHWAGTMGSNGYGVLSVGSRASIGAHRAVWEALRSPIPAGLHIDHLCRNQRCVNPDHLEPVTPRVNILRGHTVAAANAAKTYCPQGHPLFGENLMVSSRRRYCRECTRQHCREYYRRQVAQGINRNAMRRAKREARPGLPNCGVGL